MNMKDRIITARIVLFALVLSLYSCSSLEINQGARDTGEVPYEQEIVTTGPAVSIDGKAVDPIELEIFAAELEQEIMDEFVRKYHAVPGEGFWHHSFEGEVPIEHLAKWTVYEAVWTRLAQELAVEHGIRQSIGLEDKRQMLDEENLRRKEKKEKGETLYGPDQYTMREFYPLDQQSLELALIETLERKEILRDEGRGRDRRIHRIERMKMAFRQLIEERMESRQVRVNKDRFMALISPESPVN